MYRDSKLRITDDFGARRKGFCPRGSHSTIKDCTVFTFLSIGLKVLKFKCHMNLKERMLIRGRHTDERMLIAMPSGISFPANKNTSSPVN